jgi:NAD-dependent dihydropyrimidine dehydrogenase PreA subunit
MTFVITEPCIGTVDTSCVEVCPVDCIHGPLAIEEIRRLKDEGDDEALADVQLFIDPVICIDCGACEPECPVEAIYTEQAAPEKWRDYIDKNAAFYE